MAIEATHAPPKLISIREAASIASVHYSHVWRLIKRGEIPGIRVGEGHGPLRIERDVFLDWLSALPKENR